MTGWSRMRITAWTSLRTSSFWFRVRNRLITDLVRRYFPTAERVLEIGCGTGYVLQALRTALPQSCLLGSEIYANGLPYAARRLGPEVKLFQMDARDIPYATEFDLICAFDVLEHVAEDERVLHELYRALRPGGGVLLSVPQHQFLWSKSDEISLHKRRYRRGELESKCRKAKLRHHSLDQLCDNFAAAHAAATAHLGPAKSLRCGRRAHPATSSRSVARVHFGTREKDLARRRLVPARRVPLRRRATTAQTSWAPTAQH